MTPEGAVLRAVQDYLSLVLRWPHWRRNVGGVRMPGSDRFVRFGSRGQADIWGVIPGSGRHFEIEVKAPGKKPTNDQLAWLAEIRERGGVAVWCDSIEMLERKLRENGVDLRP